MKNDIDIARSVPLLPIEEIATNAGLKEDEYVCCGQYKAKVSLDVLTRLKQQRHGKLILVTTINPTASGEGKTTVTIGLAQALAQLGKKTMLAIREPSMGPIMGKKGGATGGGYSQVLPMEDINLHFTGDMHAITSAHNLLASLLDNHIHHGDLFHIDPRFIVWPRVLDISDRALRKVVVGLGGPSDGVPHEIEFSITPASEIMAVLCLCKDLQDLKHRLSRIIVAYTYDNKPVTAADLKAVGAMTVLLKDAIKPNLVQTIEGVPAFVHGGPFANIAHGSNSLIADMMGLRLADYFVTEAGFGSELGAEKFFDIVCRTGNLVPDAVVLVVSIRALKRHGEGSDSSALQKGLGNLEKHLENLSWFQVPVIVAINLFTSDADEELDVVEKFCSTKQVPCAVVDVWGKGGDGGIELAGKLISLIHNTPTRFTYLYDLDLPVKTKIDIIAKKMYGADRVGYSVNAESDLKLCMELGLDTLPICIAKTPYSLSDDPLLLGRPTGFKITVRDIKFSAGAGFLVPMTGKITTMPGLPPRPQSEFMDIDKNGNIKGLS
ncbi:MAG: formate--tetrahydrofolate ligase [Thermoplasmata archaeon M11B2D]|nr:MAG: formate--tetrahydrofolate ligase [Thermoplasmata archaeon M11B2D]PNX53090.1 MAG: formate--tetrahydrofolate ligase [Thermoplasmata archaeon M9B2D]